MNGLITNDDGIHAPGLIALHALVRDLFEECIVVAPHTVQSATSHGVTFTEPLMTREVRLENGEIGVAVEGRPADCTKLALTNIWPERYGEGTRPDLVISGMNMGANIGINILYSGTVAAAIEAAFLGVPAIAVSLHLGPNQPDYEAAAIRARRAIDRVLSTGPLQPHECLNINIPRTERDDARPAPKAVPAGDGTVTPIDQQPDLVVCPMNTHALVDRYEQRTSPGGAKYYWPAGDGLQFHGADEGADIQHLLQGRITLTPLAYDLTASTLDAWSSRLA